MLEAAAARARERGDSFFKIDLALPPAGSVDDALDVIESAGWRLEHANYVFVQNSSRESNPLMSSGRRSIIDDEIRGVDLFRAVAGCRSLS